MFRHLHTASTATLAALAVAGAVAAATAPAHADPEPHTTAATAATTRGNDTVSITFRPNSGEQMVCRYSIHRAADPTPASPWSANSTAIVPAEESVVHSKPGNHAYTHQIPDGSYAVYWQCSTWDGPTFGNNGLYAPTDGPLTFTIDTAPTPRCTGSICPLPPPSPLLLP